MRRPVARLFAPWFCFDLLAPETRAVLRSDRTRLPLSQCLQSGAADSADVCARVNENAECDSSKVACKDVRQAARNDLYPLVCQNHLWVKYGPCAIWTAGRRPGGSLAVEDDSAGTQGQHPQLTF